MSLVPYAKPPLTFDEQVARLRERGLAIGDEQGAADQLERTSYYRLSAYWHPFKKADNTVEPGASFDQAVRFYEFDRRLRLLVLDAIERFEVHLRTVVAYELSHHGGPFAHESAATFQPDFDHAGWIEDLHKESSRSRESFTEHYRTKYEGFPALPIWMATELMAFGTLSKMFKGLRPPVRQAISRRFGLHDTVLESWTHVVSTVRNVCAHHGRLWNRALGIRPRMPTKDPRWVALADESRGRLFIVLLVLRDLTRGHDAAAPSWAAAIERLVDELDGNPRWLKAMGLPSAWKTHPAWVNGRD